MRSATRCGRRISWRSPANTVWWTASARTRASSSTREDSRDLVLRMLDTIDTNATPVNRFKGEVFCSRYGIHIDWWENREANQAFFDVLMLIDGRRTIAQIARQCGVPFESARTVVETLRAHGLVELACDEGVPASARPVAAPQHEGITLTPNVAHGASMAHGASIAHGANITHGANVTTVAASEAR